MSDPARDANGFVLPYNDEDIQPDDGLLRYIDPDYHLADDENRGGKRLSSAAFSESRGPHAPYGGLSVDLENLMNEAGVSYSERTPDETWGVVRLNASDVRGIGCLVGRDPIDADPQNDVEENLQHGEVWGIQKKLRKTKNKNAILVAAKWLQKAKGVP